MTFTKEAKLEIIGKHGRNQADTGSPEVQIAMLTTRINELTEHLRAHQADHHSAARACSSSSAPAAAGLLPEAQPRGVPRPHQGAGPQALALAKEGGV